MQRVAGSLFAKMREVDQVLYWIHLDVLIIQNLVGQLTVQLDNSFRHVTDQLDTIFVHMTNRLDVNSLDMTNRFDQVALQLERLTWQLDEQRRCNRMWFILIVGINIGTFLCVMCMKVSHHSTYVLKMCNATNATDGHYPETVMDRSDIRIIGEWFEWLVVRPWMN
jgi:uncharacterized membrane protein YbjE (DUF340 family)